MSEELDVNKIAAAFLESRLDSLLDTGKKYIKVAGDKVRLLLDRTYKQYLASLLDKYSRAKSFFIRTEPVPLYSFYIPLAVTCGHARLEHPQVSDLCRLGNRLLLFGSAGSGKSMFMRHLVLNSALSKWRVPVLVELRRFNEGDVDILGGLYEVMKSHRFDLDLDYTGKAVEAGHFVVLLDGFDEVAATYRRRVMQAIHRFGDAYPETMLVVSSRFDAELEGWPGFASVKLEPLTLEQAHALVARLSFDEDLKSKFLKDLRTNLFATHESFLSNPLLLSIMLLTYGQSGNIPTKLNVFYNQAYEALFERHDALKGAFRRERRTSLDIQDLGKLFSGFCLLTNDRQRVEFSKTDALGFLSKAQTIVQVPCDEADYLCDCIQAVNLLLEDGLVIVFPHRTFQEYFAALFIASAPADVQKRLIERYASKDRVELVLRLVHEMRPDVVIRYWLLPGLEALFAKLGVRRKVGISHFVRFLKLSFSHIEVQGENLRGYINPGEGARSFDLRSFSLSEYGEATGWKGKLDSPPGDKWFKKYAQAGTVVRFDPRKMTVKTEFCRDLASQGNWLGIEALEALRKVLEYLREKTRRQEESLEDLLDRK